MERVFLTHAAGDRSRDSWRRFPLVRGPSSSPRSVAARCFSSAISWSERVSERLQTPVFRAKQHPRAQLDVFLDGAQRAPERVFELFVHAVAKALAVEPVPNVAAVPHDILLLNLTQRSPAVGAGER